MKYRTYLPRWRPKKRGKVFCQNKFRNNIIDVCKELIPNFVKYRKLQILNISSSEDENCDSLNKGRDTDKLGEKSDVPYNADEIFVERGAGDGALKEQNVGFEESNTSSDKQNNWALKALLVIKPYKDNVTCGNGPEDREDQQQSIEERFSKFKVTSLKDLCSKVIDTGVVSESLKIEENEHKDENFLGSKPCAKRRTNAEIETSVEEEYEDALEFVEGGNNEGSTDLTKGGSELHFDTVTRSIAVKKENFTSCAVAESKLLSFIEDSKFEASSLASNDNYSKISMENSLESIKKCLENKETISQYPFEGPEKDTGGIMFDESPIDAFEPPLGKIEINSPKTAHGLRTQSSEIDLISSLAVPETSKVVKDPQEKCIFPLSKHNNTSQVLKTVSKLSKCTKSLAISNTGSSPNNQTEMKDISAQIKNNISEILLNQDKPIFHEDVKRKLAQNPLETITHKELHNYRPSLNTISTIAEFFFNKNKIHKYSPYYSLYNESKNSLVVMYTGQNRNTLIFTDIQKGQDFQIFNRDQLLRMSRSSQEFEDIYQKAGTQESNSIQESKNDQTVVYSPFSQITPLFSYIEQEINSNQTKCIQQESNREKITEQHTNIVKVNGGKAMQNADMLNCSELNTEAPIDNYTQSNKGNPIFSSISQDSSAERSNSSQHSEDMPISSCTGMQGAVVSEFSCIQPNTKSSESELDSVVEDSKHEVDVNPKSSSKAKSFRNLMEISELLEYLSTENNDTEIGQKETNIQSIFMTVNESPSPFKDNEGPAVNKKNRSKELNSVDSNVREILNRKTNISEISKLKKGEKVNTTHNPKEEKLNTDDKKCSPAVFKNKTRPLKKLGQTKYGVTSSTSFSYVRKRSIKYLISAKFLKKFKDFSKYGCSRKSGLVITNERSSQWLSNAGLFEDASDVNIAQECFSKYAGCKIVLSIHDYVRYLLKLFRGRFWSENVMDRLSNVPSPYEQEYGSSSFFSYE